MDKIKPPASYISVIYAKENTRRLVNDLLFYLFSCFPSFPVCYTFVSPNCRHNLLLLFLMRHKSILFPSNAENTCAYTNVAIKKRFNVIEKRLLHLTWLFSLNITFCQKK